MWRLVEAKNTLSKLFTRALTEVLRRVRRHGETVVALSDAELERLSGDAPKKMSRGGHPLRGPSFEGIDPTRDRWPVGSS